MKFLGFELRRAKSDKLATPRAIGLETGEEMKRVSPRELELAYATDPILFNGVNIYVEVMLSCSPEIIASNEKEQRYMDEWAHRVKFKLRVLPKIVQHCCIYGNAWTEICYSKKIKDEIVKLSTRDPKYMDFRRSSLNNRIIFDKFGEPKEYVQYLEFDMPEQPNEIYQNGMRAIIIPKEKIAHTTFLTVGDSYYGIGLIEPCMNATLGKNNAQKGFTHSIFRLGFPLLGLKVGNDQVFPTPEMIDKAVEEFKNVNERTLVGYPHYVEPKIIESSMRADKLRDDIRHFTSEQISGMGVPSALVTGSGEDVNRAVLDTMLTLFYQKIRMFQESISSSLEEQLFVKIYEDKNFDDIPRLEWRESSIETLTAKSERLEKYVKVGLLKPYPELEDEIKKWERLPRKGIGKSLSIQNVW